MRIATIETTGRMTTLRITTLRITKRALGIGLMAAALARPASAQLAHASATTLGLAGTGTASARGLAALSLNPAGLGMPGSGFTLAIAPVQVRPGLDPITAKDWKDWEGTKLTKAVADQWLQKVSDSGSQAGSLGAEVTAIGLAAGRFGFQVSTVASGEMDLSPQIMELILFGNAGRTGSAGTFTLAGSSVDAFAVTTFSASAGFPIPTTTGSTALGATLKYLVGNGLVFGNNSTGSFAPDKITFSFPVILTKTDNDEYSWSGNGSGLGLDIGVQSKRGLIAFGAAIQNLLNTFKWDEASLAYRPVAGSIDSNLQDTNADEQPLSSAPAALRAALDDLKFKPAIAVGLSYDANPDLTVTADLRDQLGDGMKVGPKMRVGAGAEYRGLKVLHLRGGLAKITDGAELAGGFSLILGPVSLSAAGAKQSGDVNAQLAQFTLSFGGR